MTTILKKWLTLRLDIPLKWEPREFGLAVRDGFIISKLLHSYSVISREQCDSIVRTSDHNQIKSNLTNIKDWLEDINIELSSDDIKCIADGKGSFSLGLFYQMFLELDNKNKLYFIGKKIKNSRDKSKSLTSNVVNEDLTNMADVIKEIVNEDHSNFTLTDLKSYEGNKNAITSSLFDFGDKAEIAILERMSRQYAQKQNEKATVKTLIELSRHEKQMADELLMAKREVDLLIQNRLRQQEEIAKQRETEFEKALDDIRREMRQQARKLEIEKDILSILEKKLDSIDNFDSHYESLRICRETAIAILDFACNVINFKEASTEDAIPEMYMSVWKTMFVHGKSQENEEQIDEIYYNTMEDDVSALDEADIDNYIGKRDIWSEDLFPDVEEACANLEAVSSILLGNIVKKVMSQKYKIADEVPAQDSLPQKEVRAVLLSSNGFGENKQFLDLMKRKNVGIVSLNGCFQYCLEQLKKELIDFDEMTLDFKEFETKARGLTEEDSVREYRKSSILMFDEDNVEAADKSTQTPSKMPTQEKYSDSAQLGRLIYESMKCDSGISNCLMSSVIVNYIKNHPERRGWVLLDYPENYDEAMDLEEKMMGKIFSKSSDTAQPSTKLYQSRIVRLPEDHREIEEFQSFFTVVLKLKPSLCVANEDFVLKLTEANSNSMERMYAGQGISYYFYYESLDSDTVTLIGNHLIRDTNGSAHKISFVSKDFNDDKHFVKTKLIHLVVTEARAVSDSSSELDVSRSKSVQSLQNNLNDSIVFIDHDLSDELCNSVCSHWELTETTYLNDLKEMFNAKRNILNDLICYMSYARKTFSDTNPNYALMQDIVSALQCEAESIDRNSPKLERAKSSVYFKIDEARNELKALLRNKVAEYEEKRKKLIDDNWVVFNMREMVNIFVNLIQIEITRTVNTLKIIYNYYSAILNCPALKSELTSLTLPKLTIDSATDAHAQDGCANVSDFVGAKLFVNDEFSNSDNPFVLYADQTKTCVEDYAAIVQSFYADVVEKERNKVTKSSKHIKAKTAHNPHGVLNKSAGVIAEWENVLKGEICRLKRQNMSIHRTAVEQLNQAKRFVFKTFYDIHRGVLKNYEKDERNVELICNALTLAVDKLINIPVKIVVRSENMEDEIRDVIDYIIEKDSLKYEDKCDFCIGLLAEIHAKFMGITKYCSIPKDLMVIVLQDFFLLDDNVDDGKRRKRKCKWNLLEPRDLEKIVDEVYGQMDYVDWRDFLLLCLDISFPNEEVLMDLRNSFVKCDLNQNETIYRENYYNVKLWFEPEEGCNDRSYNLRCCLIKELIFLLFEVDHDVMNYSGFLLASCKSESSAKGFIRALNLALGKKICEDVGKIEEFTKRRQRERSLRKRLHESAMSFAGTLVGEIVDRTVRECSGVNITDIVTPKSSSECFNRNYIGGCDEKQVKSLSVNVVKSRNASKSSLKSDRSTRSSRKRTSRTSTTLHSVAEEQLDDTIEGSDEVFMVSETVVRKVLIASLPWHCQVEFASPYGTILVELQTIFSELKYDNNTDDIFVEQLLHHHSMKDILNRINKFKICKPCRTVAELVYDKCNILTTH